MSDPIPFEQDTQHASYDSAAVERFHGALSQVDRVFRESRAGFVGKSSPSHFFWGAMDLAVTRFNGQRAPARDPKDPYHTFFFSLDNGDVIDAAIGGNESRWINHSCDPNCETNEEDDRIFVYALKRAKCRARSLLRFLILSLG